MATSTAIASRRIPELDGRRGIAILLVISFHFINQEGVQPNGSVADGLQRLVIMGWTGVDLFFVLSGFLIGGILLGARESPRYFKTFYARRFFRIVPIYYLWILAYVALIAGAGSQVTRLSNSGLRPPLNGGIFLYFLFLQNIIAIPVFGIAGAWFGHLWSLAVEEQFYLAAPLVVRFAPKRLLPWIFGAIIVSVPLIRILLLKVGHMPESFLGASVLCRADALAIGMVCAVLVRSKHPTVSAAMDSSKLRMALGLLLLGVIALWWYAPQGTTFGMQSLGYTWMAFFYAVLLLLAVGYPEGVIARACRMRWLREVGLVSYCAYIIHIVVNVTLHALLLRSSPKISTSKGAAVTILAVFVTYALAKGSWLVLEAPLQRRGHTFKY